MLGKTFKGMTDQMLAWQTEKLLQLEIARDAYTVYVRPELVVEIAFNDVQESPHYPGGLALRFARVKSYRADKRRPKRTPSTPCARSIAATGREPPGLRSRRCFARPGPLKPDYVHVDGSMGVLLTPIVVKETIAPRRSARQAAGGGRERRAVPVSGAHPAARRHPAEGLARPNHVASLGAVLSHDAARRRIRPADGVRLRRPPAGARRRAEIARRRAVRERYEDEAAAARRAGDLAQAYSKSTMTSRLTPEMIAEAKELLRLMGLPVVQAPSEAEAQAAHMARRGDVWAAASKDYDALLFGAPRVVRFLTISGREFLPSQGTFRPITPEVIDLRRMLDALGITRAQLIDLGLLVGTDFHPGVKGIGPKKALALVTRHGAIEHMPAAIRDAFGADLDRLRQIYLEPDVRDDYGVGIGTLRCGRSGPLSVR